MDYKTAFRTAAVLYADDSQLVSTRTIHKKIVESYFLDNKNQDAQLTVIVEGIKKKLDMSFSEEEIESIVNSDRNKDFIVRIDANKDAFIRLSEKRYTNIQGKAANQSIEVFIEHFINEMYEGELSKERIAEVLTRYFYELLNKNANAFSKILKGNYQAHEIMIDSAEFSAEERRAINEFLFWNNPEKNKGIFNVVSYSIEFASITNNIDINNVTIQTIAKKVFYLDNNIIYRAIGINGEARKQRIISFLKKCQQNGQMFLVSKYTIQEFKETVNYHVGLLQRVPFGRINPAIFEKYAINPSIYEFYHQWRATRNAYGFDLFIAHIHDLYRKFIQLFEVNEDYKIPYDESDEKVQSQIEKYTAEIRGHKGHGYDESHRFDAWNTFLIESKRGEHNKSLPDTKFYFVSADQKLRNWDFSRNQNQPVALLPSQWMSLLLKYFNRSEDDFKSFAQFLQLRQDSPVISEDKLQIILAGVSEMTEDFQKQEQIVKKMIEVKFDKAIDLKDLNESREKASEFAKAILEEELNQLLASHREEVERLTQSNESKGDKLKAHEQRLREEYLTAFRSMQAQKPTVDGEVIKRFTKHRNFLILIAVLWYVVIAILVFWIGWDKMEPITYLLSFGFIIGGYIYLAIKGEDLNPLKYFEHKKEKIRNDIYLRYNFNEARFDFLAKQVS